MFFPWLAAAILLLIPGPAFCQTIGKTVKTDTYQKPSELVSFEAGELAGVEVPFFGDLSDGAMDEHDLYDAFVVASEITDEAAFLRYRGGLETIRRETFDAMDAYGEEDDRTRAKQLLLHLHDTALKTYREKATLASDIVDRGEFNCLSSAILYALLAGDLGIEAQGVAVQGHAFCRVALHENGKKKYVDVETTVRYGFEPGQKELDEMRNVIVSVPKKAYGRRETIPLNLLVAMLYANTISILDGGSVSDEVDLGDMPRYKKGLYFDPSSNFFRTNLIAAFNKLALKEIAAGNFPAAEDYLKKGFVLDTANAALRQNYKYLYNEWGITYLNKNDYDGAIGLFDKALAVFEGDGVFRRNLLYAYNQKGLAYYEAGDAAAAVRTAREGLARFPGEAALLNIAERIKVDYYNAGVIAFNAQQYAEAARNAREGLAVDIRVPSIDSKLSALLEAAQR